MLHVKPLINISQRQGVLFALFLVIYEFLTYISNDMILPGMYQVIREFHANPSNIASAVTCFMIGGASLQFIIGPLSDAYGRRKVMLGGVVLFLISSFLLAIAHNMHQFLIERIFQGMGVCFIGTIGYATLQEIFNDTDAVKLTAIMSSISIISPLLGPLVGAWMVIHTSWREIFELVVVCTIIAFWGLWKFMPEPIGKTKNDGILIASQPLNLKKIIHNYGILLSHSNFMSNLLTYSVMAVPCMIWIALSPVMIITHENSHSLYEYSLWQVPMFSAFIFANTLLQKWVEKFKLQDLMKKGTYIVIVALIMSIFLVHYFGTSYYAFIPCFIAYFFGYATASSPFYRQLFSLSPVPRGATAALISLISMIIQSIGIEIANHIFHHFHFEGLAWLLMSLGSIIVGLQFFNQQEEPTSQEIA